MNIQKYLEKIKDFQRNLLNYLDDEIEEQEYHNMIKYLQDQFDSKEIQEIKETLQLILNIVNNHHRSPNFWEKVDKFLINFKDSLQRNMTNFEIFDFFKSNKRILLFLIKESIIEIDQSVLNVINDSKFWNEQYIKYFLIESKQFISELLYQEIKENLNNDDLEYFERNRQIGENDSYICDLIRNDSIDEFVKYVSKTSLPLSSTIKQSIYETNSFLLNKNVSLIEYAAFFGSIQIFQYLRFNQVELKSSLWLFAIHGKNPELIHLLEDNQIEPEDKDFNLCFEESIKCYSNDVALYIENTYLDNNSKQNLFNVDLYYKYRNYEFFQNDFDDPYVVFLLSKYNYIFLVDKITKACKLDINKVIILKKKLKNLMTF